MANRSTLHISKLEAFKEWLIKDGWEIEEPKGFYEVLRARKKGRENPLIVYKKLEAKEHLSLLDRDTGVVYAFLKNAKKQQTNADRIRSMSDEELAEIIACPMAMGEDCEEFALSIESNCVECRLEWLQKEVEE